MSRFSLRSQVLLFATAFIVMLLASTTVAWLTSLKLTGAISQANYVNAQVKSLDDMKEDIEQGIGDLLAYALGRSASIGDLAGFAELPQLIVGLVAVLISTGIAFAFGRQLSGPVTGAAAAVQQLMDKNYDEEIQGLTRKDEVGSIALKSAQSANEIKELVTEAAQQVSAGERLVQGTGDTLSQIASSVTRVSGMISSIANSSSEQAQGIKEINSGVAQLDRVTQDNAAMVQESYGASRQMRAEASRLSELLLSFTGQTQEGAAVTGGFDEAGEFAETAWLDEADDDGLLSAA